MLTQLQHCATCREEYAAIRNVLRVADQSFRSNAPAESFWPGYDARLRQRLADLAQSSAETAHRPARFARFPLVLKRIATSSVRVPVPVAVVLLLAIGFAVVFFLRSHSSAISGPKPVDRVSVVTKTVEVPVVREKIVTRVVYLPRNVRQIRGSQNPIAKRVTPDNSAPSLVGFKPTDHIKLTVIKGSYQDEK